jgi:hypothetical protein
VRRLVVAGALLATGCTSQWYPGFERRDIVRTDVEIRTEPPGATIYMNGTKLASPSPLRQPIEYDHVERLYERQNNVAMVYHYKEDLRRHEYAGNRYKFEARLPGYYDTAEEVVLEGEAQKVVTIKLPKIE